MVIVYYISLLTLDNCYISCKMICNPINCGELTASPRKKLYEVETLCELSLASMMGTMSKLSPFRYDPTHILLQFQNEDGCEALGQAFLDEKLDDVDGFKVIDIERE